MSEINAPPAELNKVYVKGCYMYNGVKDDLKMLIPYCYDMEAKLNINSGFEFIEYWPLSKIQEYAKALEHDWFRQNLIDRDHSSCEIIIREEKKQLEEELSEMATRRAEINERFSHHENYVKMERLKQFFPKFYEKKLKKFLFTPRTQFDCINDDGERDGAPS